MTVSVVNELRTIYIIDNFEFNSIKKKKNLFTTNMLLVLGVQLLVVKCNLPPRRGHFPPDKNSQYFKIILLKHFPAKLFPHGSGCQLYKLQLNISMKKSTILLCLPP